MKKDERYRTQENSRGSGRRYDYGDDAGIEDMLDRRRRNREYEDFIGGYTSSRGDDDDDRGISRESRAARRVLDEGRVTEYSRRNDGRSSSSRQTYSRSYDSRSSGRGSSRSSGSYSGRNGSGRYTHSNNNREYYRADRNSGSQDNRRMGLGDIVKRLATAVVMIAVAVVILYFTLMNLLTAGINRTDIDTSLSVMPDESVEHIEVRSDTSFIKNVLLLGIDDDGSSGSRSDTIMIASVNTRDGTIKLCSILRDNFVTIPGYGRSRINSAYAYGGAELTLQTIEANFRLHIDHYVSVDMEAMRHIVDAVGGVTITITEAEAGQINRYSWSSAPDVSAGEMLLDGRQAVSYAQIRKIDSDFGRTSRQRILISAIMAKCRELSVFELMGLVRTVSPYLTTDLSSSQIATLGLQVLPALGGELGQHTLPADGTYRSETIREMSVLVADLEENTRLLHEFLYGEA